MHVLKHIMTGVVAGAAGTVALNGTTYGDMALRGRGSSSTPKKVVDTSAQKAGVDLTPEGGGQKELSNRESGLGSLMGILTGLGVGAAYGLVRPHVPGVPTSLAALGVGAAAMAGSNVPMTALGVTDPRKWGAKSWAMDIVPHIAYGLATASVFDHFDDTMARRS